MLLGLELVEIIETGLELEGMFIETGRLDDVREVAGRWFSLMRRARF